MSKIIIEYSPLILASTVEIDRLDIIRNLKRYRDCTLDEIKEILVEEAKDKIRQNIYRGIARNDLIEYTVEAAGLPVVVKGRLKLGGG